MSSVKLVNITKSFDEKIVLQDINISRFNRMMVTGFLLYLLTRILL